jgi:CYTH domain-containing protein
MRPAGNQAAISMPVEIERKFLVCGAEWRRDAQGQRYCQGYLARLDGVAARVRRATGSKADQPIA